ncbi:hypothetical protein N7461_000886 [Penicillium sp. DV-2018c]|nr:hypothetical protein N7461_000886 [Penicillium sp. DV-2018c]
MELATQKEKEKKDRKTKTYNSEDSLVVTHPTTNSPACGLSTAERTGSPVFHTLWSYVQATTVNKIISCVMRWSFTTFVLGSLDEYPAIAK